MNFNKYSENIQGHIYIGHGLQITYVGQGLFSFLLCLFAFTDHHYNHYFIFLNKTPISQIKTSQKICKTSNFTWCREQ